MISLLVICQIQITRPTNVFYTVPTWYKMIVFVPTLSDLTIKTAKQINIIREHATRTQNG